MQKLMLQNQLTIMYALIDLIKNKTDREELTRQIIETVKAIDDLRVLENVERLTPREKSSVPF